MTQDERNRRLVEAIQQLDVAAVETLLAEGADPNAIAYGCVIRSFIMGEVRKDPYAVELLFEKSNFDPQTYKIRLEVEPILLALSEKGIDPNLFVRGRIPLISRAAECGLDACVLSLLEHGGDLHLRSTQGEMTLHCAIGHCSLETIKVLVEKGADVNALAGGLPPLNYALSDHANRDVFDYLRSQGAMLRKRDASGEWIME